MNRNFNELDGELDYDATLAISPVRGNPVDMQNFYPASGEHSCACGCKGGENHSSALGGLIPNRKQLEQMRQARMQRRNLKAKAKVQTQNTKAKAKLVNAQAQKAAAQNINRESKSDIALANALAGSAPKTKAPAGKKGLSTGAIIGISVAGVALVGTVVYLIVKKRKK